MKNFMHQKLFVFSLLAIQCLLFSSSLRADQFEQFKARVERNYLKPFLKDVGGLIGSGSFHTGRALGFPGVDLGLHMSFQPKPSDDNKILKDAKVDNLILPIAQGEIGLPYNFDVIVRGISFQEVAIVGAGLRYGLFKLRLVPLTPAMSVSVMTHVFNHSFFSLTHYSGNIAFDVSLPVISPYLGVGLDHTRIKVKESNNASLVGLIVKTNAFRGSVGLNFRPLPFVYIHGGASFLHGQTGYEAGLGVRF